MKSRAEILNTLKDVLEEIFEIDPEEVQESSHLYNDLELDSIDAVDLVIKLQEITGKKIKPEEFKSVRTVSDVIDSIEKLVA
ncbi:acyl carrier protein [Pleionea sediminis]|uniref:acyl carrier protein n=1 Tax=Pleionea sediminis TaxID=2569479 RepID=UPI00118523D9|nr:acyl carrier protein [Pleionea sediminis]